MTLVDGFISWGNTRREMKVTPFFAKDVTPIEENIKSQNYYLGTLMPKGTFTIHKRDFFKPKGDWKEM